MPTPPKIDAMPVYLEQYWDTKLFPEDKTKYAQFINAAIDNNLGFESADKKNGSIICKPIARAEIINAVAVLSDFYLQYPKDTTQSQLEKETKALQTMVDYKIHGGADYIYFDREQQSYTKVVAVAYDGHGAYETLKKKDNGHIDAAIVDKAVSAFLEKPANMKDGGINLDPKVINAERDLIAAQKGLMNALHKDQDNLREKFINPQEAARSPQFSKAPEVDLSRGGNAK